MQSTLVSVVERPRRALVGVALAGAVVAAPVLMSSSALARPAPDGFANLIEQVGPAVVQIAAKKGTPEAGMPEREQFSVPEQFREGPFGDFFERFFGERMPHGTPGLQPERAAMGSGFIIDAEGIVVTNNHVVADASRISVTLSDGRSFPAQLLGADDKTDLAVLEIETDERLPAVRWGDSDGVRVGDWVVAVGNPFGLGGTATAGIISARGRDIGSGPYDDFIQIDAPINRGNSGGPLFGLDGGVIGVNTAIFSPSGGNVGIGFAIPSNLAESIVDELRETGGVERGWLGVSIQPVTPDIAESLGLEKAGGALVANVTPRSPAASAGLRSGDVVLAFDRREIEELRDLTRAVAEAEIGARIPIAVWRGGQEEELTARIGEMPQQLALAKATSEGVELPALGVTVAEVDERIRARLGLDDAAEGVVITRVSRDADAAEKGLRRGDLITHVNQRPVSSTGELAEVVEDARTAERQAVLLRVEREGTQRFVAIQLSEA